MNNQTSCVQCTRAVATHQPRLAQKVALGFPSIQRRVLGFPAGKAAAAETAAAAPPLSPSQTHGHGPGGVRPPAVAAPAEAGQKQQLVEGLEARMQAFVAQRDIGRLLEGVMTPHPQGVCGLLLAGCGREVTAILWTGRGPPAARLLVVHLLWQPASGPLLAGLHTGYPSSPLTCPHD